MTMKDAIKALLMRDDKLGQLAVTTALVRLYARQTADEQAQGTTTHTNGRGFSAFDANNGTYMAQYALGATRQNPKGVVEPRDWDDHVVKLRNGEGTPIRLISGSFLIKGRKLCLKYIGQLVEEAEIRKACEAA
jgi:hypothetical protein